MVCFGYEPGATGSKAQTDPLSYGGQHLCTERCHVCVADFLFYIYASVHQLD